MHTQLIQLNKDRQIAAEMEKIRKENALLRNNEQLSEH
jgi:hypothetical protein